MPREHIDAILDNYKFDYLDATRKPAADKIALAKKILNIADNTSLSEINKAYISLYSNVSPDKYPEDPKRAQGAANIVSWAYKILASSFGSRYGDGMDDPESLANKESFVKKLRDMVLICSDSDGADRERTMEQRAEAIKTSFLSKISDDENRRRVSVLLESLFPIAPVVSNFVSAEKTSAEWRATIDYLLGVIEKNPAFARTAADKYDQTFFDDLSHSFDVLHRNLIAKAEELGLVIDASSIPHMDSTRDFFSYFPIRQSSAALDFTAPGQYNPYAQFDKCVLEQQDKFKQMAACIVGLRKFAATDGGYFRYDETVLAEPEKAAAIQRLEGNKVSKSQVLDAHLYSIALHFLGNDCQSTSAVPMPIYPAAGYINKNGEPISDDEARAIVKESKPATRAERDERMAKLEIERIFYDIRHDHTSSDHSTDASIVAIARKNMAGGNINVNRLEKELVDMSVRIRLDNFFVKFKKCWTQSQLPVESIAHAAGKQSLQRENITQAKFGALDCLNAVKSYFGTANLDRIGVEKINAFVKGWVAKFLELGYMITQLPQGLKNLFEQGYMSSTAPKGHVGALASAATITGGSVRTVVDIAAGTRSTEARYAAPDVHIQDHLSYYNFEQLRDGNYFIRTATVDDARLISDRLATRGIVGGSGKKFPGPHTSFSDSSNPSGIILTPDNIKKLMHVDPGTTTQRIEQVLANLLSLDKTAHHPRPFGR